MKSVCILIFADECDIAISMRLHIQVKATISIALLVLLMLTASGWFLSYTARKALDGEMGQRLIAIAKASIAQMKWNYLGE